jgi:hypothetical protein
MAPPVAGESPPVDKELVVEEAPAPPVLLASPPVASTFNEPPVPVTTVVDGLEQPHAMIRASKELSAFGGFVV